VGVNDEATSDGVKEGETREGVNIGVRVGTVVAEGWGEARVMAVGSEVGVPAGVGVAVFWV